MTPEEVALKLREMGNLNRYFPDGLNLHKFQYPTVTKLAPHKSVLIGDDMGLGKTVEAIALDVLRRRVWRCDYSAQTLVITKSSVLGVWERHYNQWAPYLKVVSIDPKNRPAFVRALMARDAKGRPVNHVFVMHWQAVRLLQKELSAVKWFHIIGDECQNMKNRKAQTTRAVKTMRPYYKTLMSGTWADNKPEDTWQPLNYLWPHHFSSYNQFVDYHVIYKRHHADDDCNNGAGHNPNTRPYNETMGVANEKEILDFIDHAYVRRLKKEVLKDLPDKYYSTIEVDLYPVQRRAYNDMREIMLAWIGEHESEPVAAPVVIAQLQRLQQFAIAHARLEKILRRKKDCEFCTKAGEARCKGHDHWVVRLAEPSAKLDAVMDLLEESTEPLVVFSRSKQAINLLVTRLAAKGIPTGVLTGDTPMVDRDQLVQEFQAGKYRVFASTIQAGGDGITLTRASTVVFLDREWSPSKNKQAEDRLHRLGQDNAVHVIDIVGRDTLDKHRNSKILLKWSWLRKVMGDG
jgi:SNF2 family DNA or RNA helicase